MAEVTALGFGLDGSLTTITSPNGAVETRSYDADGHLVAQTVVADGVTITDKTFTVDAAGRITRVDDTGTAAAYATVTYGYDDTGRLTEECHQASCAGPSDPFTRWSYDAAGRRTAETSPAGVTTYSYDVDGNLAATTGPAGTTTYTYDPAGRRVAEAGPAGNRTFTWDAAGRLDTVTDTAGTTGFSYDGDGVRTGTAGPAGDVNLTWDPNEPLAQPVHVTVDDGTTEVEQFFAWGVAGAPAWATVDTGSGAAVQVVHTDQVWNPTVHTGAVGAVSHNVLHDSWGADSTVTAVNPAAPAPTIGHSSTVDAASAVGLVHMRARDYDPATGQFLSPDPWVRPDGQPWVGVHSYTDGDPVSFWDPSGLRECRGFAAFCALGRLIGMGPRSPDPADTCAGWDIYCDPVRLAGAGVIVVCVAATTGYCLAATIGYFGVESLDDLHGNGWTLDSNFAKRRFCSAASGAASLGLGGAASSVTGKTLAAGADAVMLGANPCGRL